MDRRVVCAALLYEIPKACDVLVIGPRHFDMVMVDQIESYGLQGCRPVPIQGFIDQFGKFMSREEAFQVASKAGQIIRRCGGDEGRLFSENLY